MANFAYLNVVDADALHAEFIARGAIVPKPPENKPRGMREFLVLMPDGHRMMFGQALD